MNIIIILIVAAVLFVSFILGIVIYAQARTMKDQMEKIEELIEEKEEHNADDDGLRWLKSMRLQRDFPGSNLGSPLETNPERLEFEIIDGHIQIENFNYVIYSANAQFSEDGLLFFQIHLLTQVFQINPFACTIIPSVYKNNIEFSNTAEDFIKVYIGNSNSSFLKFFTDLQHFLTALHENSLSVSHVNGCWISEEGNEKTMLWEYRVKNHIMTEPDLTEKDNEAIKSHFTEGQLIIDKAMCLAPLVLTSLNAKVPPTFSQKPSCFTKTYAIL